MWVAVGLFYQMIPKHCMLEWAGAIFVKLTKIQAWQELVFVLSAISNIESCEKASKLSFWWQFMKEYALLCVYSDICHRHFMLHRAAISYIIERFGYFLVFHSINHSSIQYRQIFWYHLIEETHSYPHLWQFSENILIYIWGDFWKV